MKTFRITRFRGQVFQAAVKTLLVAYASAGFKFSLLLPDQVPMTTHCEG